MSHDQWKALVSGLKFTCSPYVLQFLWLGRCYKSLIATEGCILKTSVLLETVLVCIGGRVAATAPWHTNPISGCWHELQQLSVPAKRPRFEGDVPRNSK
jgi:hypothetical protein